MILLTYGADLSVSTIPIGALTGIEIAALVGRA